MKMSLAGMDWQVCEPSPGGNNPIQATINIEAGKVYCSRRAWRAAGSPDAFMLMYSREHKSIGLRPCHATERGSTPVTMPGGTTPLLCARTLTNAMRSGGRRGTWRIPLQWHPDGLLWGDLSMATQFQRKSKAKGVAA